jgi:hypothetical protein
MPRREHPPVSTPLDTFLDEVRAIGNVTAISILGTATDLLEIARSRPEVLREGDELLAKEARRDLERAAHILAGIGRRWGGQR